MNIDSAKKTRAFRFESVLHPTDLNMASRTAYLHALRIGLSTRGQLGIFHVNRTGQSVSLDRLPSVRQTLVEWKSLPSGRDFLDVADLGLTLTKRVSYGRLVTQVVEECKRQHSDLLVLSTHDHSSRVKFFAGSTAETLSRKSGISTLFVPQNCDGFVETNGKVALQKVLFPVSANTNFQHALHRLLALIETFHLYDVEIRVFYVGKEKSFPTMGIPSDRRSLFRRVTKTGPVTPTIVDYCKAWRPDLVVMSTDGHNSLKDTLCGSATERVLHECGCPLLAVPSKPL